LRRDKIRFFGMGMALEAFDDHQIGRLSFARILGERRLGFAAQLVDERPSAGSTPPRLHWRRPRGAATKSLPRPIDIELVVRMLDRRHFQPASDQNGITLVISVVLPDPLQPAIPTMRMLLRMVHRHYDREGSRFCDLAHGGKNLRSARPQMPAPGPRNAQGAPAGAGDSLIVACTDPLAGIDIPNLLRETGDALEEARQEARVTTFSIRKSCRSPHTAPKLQWTTDVRRR